MLQEKVIVNGHKLFSYIYAYAEDVKNTKLKEKVDISVSTMRNLRDAELTPKINKVLDMIAGLENEIAPYGATPQKIDALKNQMNEFEEQLPSTRNNKSSVKSANGKLRAAMKEAIDLLQSRIDKLMVRFEEDDPAFYTEHLANRKVVDYGRRYEEPEETDEQKTDLVK
jgi:vacuolar-type H+-ATPase subunit I/STV1